jgi:hypothetical protein
MKIIPVAGVTEWVTHDTISIREVVTSALSTLNVASVMLSCVRSRVVHHNV